jgi:hypothetical protein
LSAERLQLLTLLLTFALLSNIPLGFLRARSRRFSFRWYLFIHLSIPFIIILRSLFDFDWRLIPGTLLSAACGQLIGSGLKRKYP